MWRFGGARAYLWKNFQLLKSSIHGDIAIGMQAVFHTNDLIVITMDKCRRLLTDDLVNLILINRNVFIAMCNFMADNLS